MLCICTIKVSKGCRMQQSWTRPGLRARVLLTHDLDFGELVAASGAKLPSIVVFRLANMHPDREVR